MNGHVSAPYLWSRCYHHQIRRYRRCPSKILNVIGRREKRHLSLSMLTRVEYICPDSCQHRDRH